MKKRTAASYVSDLLSAYLANRPLDYQEQHEEVSLVLSSLGKKISGGEEYERYSFLDDSTLLLYPPFIFEESPTEFLARERLPDFLKGIKPHERIPFMEEIAAQVTRQSRCTRYSFVDLPAVLVYPLIWSVDPFIYEDK